MKYRNASEILPDELLKELQKYAPGELLYVPSDKGRKQWGEHSGAKTYYSQRNEEIRDKFFRIKAAIPDLCDEYGLSEDTIRNICYR
jgi:hypothetical protein